MTWGHHDVRIMSSWGHDAATRKNQLFIPCLLTTLFKSIPMLCRAHGIPHIHPRSVWTWRIFYGIMLVPQNIVMDQNNVMLRAGHIPP